MCGSTRMLRTFKLRLRRPTHLAPNIKWQWLRVYPIGGGAFREVGLRNSDPAGMWLTIEVVERPPNTPLEVVAREVPDRGPWWSGS